MPADRFRTVPEALSYWARVTPDAVTLLAPDREPVTYRELQDAVDLLAGELSRLGIGRQDGVALVFPEGRELCLALLATISAGIAAPLAWPNPEAEYRRVWSTPRVRAVMVSAEIPRLEVAPGGDPLPFFTFTPGSSGRVGDFRLDGPVLGRSALAPAPADDIALILRSSGTTGQPKLVPRTHRHLVSTCQAHVEATSVSAADRCLYLAKTVFSQGICTLTTAIFVGASAINPPKWDKRSIVHCLRVCRPTYLATSPAVLRALAADRGELREALRHAPLRCIQSSSSPLSADERDRLEAAFGCPILNNYGMSEATVIATERHAGVPRVPGSVGFPCCGVQIVDERGTPVGRGAHGEIVVRGSRVISGYLDDPAANVAAFLPGGWLRTGDAGFLDDAGYLHLIGRLGEIINRGGEKIVPSEVDDVLRTHPAVADAAVFAVADDRLGQNLVAAVVLNAGMSASPRELRSWMLDRLASYKAPRRIWFVADLPRTATGKVRRGVLRERFLAQTGA